MQYHFEWNSQKAKTNITKHKVYFENAATVFQDPKAISLFDDKHSEKEDRWITLGSSSDGSLLVVHHTFNQTDNKTANIRIISSRKATKKEVHYYLEEQK